MAVKEFALYLLVHPERYPTNDVSVICADGEAQELLLSLESGFDAAYGDKVMTQVGAAERAVAILDPYDIENLLEEELLGDNATVTELLEFDTHKKTDCLLVTEGVPLRSFDALLEADPSSLKGAVAGLTPPHEGACVLLGGFARSDCVARTQEAMRALGWETEVCEETTLPLSDQGILSYLC
jgi:hypothetical protein